MRIFQHDEHCPALEEGDDEGCFCPTIDIIPPRQCKDIDKVDVLRAIQRRQRAYSATIWDIEEDFPDVPPKLLLAKLRQMVRAGWIDGCICGCRGDFEIVNMSGVGRYIRIPITPMEQRSYDYSFPKIWIIG